MRTVLISGASISGPALAWWLRRWGWVPTLLDRAPAPRPGGHAIDVRGAALDVLRAMGLADLAQAQRTRMKGVSMLDAQGNEVWKSDSMTISGGSFNKAAIEILRDDLSRILVSSLPPDIEVIYGDSVTSLEEDADGITVGFQQGASRRFDLVVGADGLASNIRKLVFGPDSEYLKPFNVALAPFSAPNTLGIQDWQITYSGGKDSCMIYTARDNRELRVCFGFEVPLKEVPTSRAAQLALVRRNCSDMGWQIPQLLDAMDRAPDFYLGPMAQVRMPGWTRGRIALVGDAGYCPSPYTGQGTSLALVGAYVLAWELAQSPSDHARAFARYDGKMRPFVEKNQALADLTRNERLSDLSTIRAPWSQPWMLQKTRLSSTVFHSVQLRGDDGLEIKALKGKSALVTGASQGIGLACAAALAQDGATVVIMGRDQDRLGKALTQLRARFPDRRIEMFAGDGIAEEDVKSALTFTHALADRLDIVVSTVGGPVFQPLLMRDTESVRQEMDRNFLTGFMITRHGAPLMKRSGAIVCISTAAATQPTWGLSIYAAGKAALERFVRAAALELAGAGIRINAVRPGATLPEERAAQPEFGAMSSAYIARTPMGRLGNPDDIARAVRFLAGPESAWVTGQTFSADGGLDQREGPDFMDAFFGKDVMDQIRAGKAAAPPRKSRNQS